MKVNIEIKFTGSDEIIDRYSGISNIWDFTDIIKELKKVYKKWKVGKGGNHVWMCNEFNQRLLIITK